MIPDDPFNFNHAGALGNFGEHEVRLRHLPRQHVLPTVESGRHLLYACPICKRPWYKGAGQEHPRLTPEQLTFLGAALRTDVHALHLLPRALCPICSTIYLGGMFSVEAYPRHRGYRFLWESASPRRIRLPAMVCQREGLTLDLLVQMSPETRTEPMCEMRAVLAWLETCPFPETVQGYTDEHSQYLARRCPPGSAPDGSVHLWRGYAWEERCPPLGGDVLVSLAVALHPLAPSPFVKTVDSSLGSRVRAELGRQGVQVETGVRIERIDRGGLRLRVRGSPSFQATADLVLVAVSVEPRSDLARATHIEVGERGAIRVSRQMQTSVSDIYAAGDCVETWHRLLSRPTYLPLGTTAHKQGRIAGENAVGGTREFAGTLGTQVVKIFDLMVARTGLRDEEARQAGFAPFTVETTSWDHKVYSPGAHEIHIRLTGDRQTGRLLGAQIVGHVQAEVAKRIDVVATTLFNGMEVEELNDFDLSYTPPLSSPWDPIQMSAQSWIQAARASGRG